ncbi:LamG-like jellyroll fold domain-containing protein [Streptomyces sp. Li-HN-5-11]|uniref:LamG-like jellyroll fold domain-containing protein n=1 Tax=Streptomyces sp. Li-HN-5-11 TaxID=3075432 RepID=UPI0028ADCC68|nr:LamG-like jellyroll fold domain-containing protein [Streptomyces sp. Li-HN-5-11]WNM36016.1 LamG-like jellyroll fold domain-containing protein [Streptomyces sp. Li-HN-5-11]
MTPAATAVAAGTPVATPASSAVGEANSRETTTDKALAEAKRTGESVAVASLTGESSDTYATPDGNLEAREYLRPVRARVGGEWKPIDTDLSKTADGMVAAKATTVGLEFSGGGDAPLVRMTKAGRELSLSWPGKLPAPALDGATATYHDVLPDVDLRMGAQADGFTQLLVVKSAKAAASSELSELRLNIAADGMDVRETGQGGLEAVDTGASRPVFEAPKPVMWDSSTTNKDAQPAAPTHTRTAAFATTANAAQEHPVQEPAAGESRKLADVGVDVASGGKELVLTPDAGLLKGKDTQFPLFIDPQWYSPRAAAWTMVSKYWASSPQWKFNGEDNAGLGYCGWYYCEPYDTKRLFYQIPTSKFAGKSILSAEFVVRNVWSASCSARSVELWRTKGISSSTTWNSENASGFWIKQLASKPFAYGYEGCSAKDAEFDVKSAVQEAANGHSSTMTFGMRAASETDAYGWKRFSDKAYLRVKYNRPPPQIRMPQLTMEYGGTCKNPSDAPRVRTLGTIYANNVTDPDGDSVAVQFEAEWDGGAWKPARTGFKKSGSDFAISLPSSIPEGKQVHWSVRAYDGAQYSPWSWAGDPTSCYFYYDTHAPKPPAITSNDYPPSAPDNADDPWYDGIGKYGAFSVGGNDSQTVKYLWGINVDPSPKNAISTSNGATKSLQLLPPLVGVNTLYVSSVDAAGNVSAPAGYRFRVKAGQPERAMWQMDEAVGAGAAKGTAPERTLALRGGATPGVAGVTGTAVSFDGVDDYAASDIPTVDTSASFSVSAWAKMSTMPDHAAIIAAQPGNHAPGFELYYSKDLDRWVFNQYKADAPGAGIVRAMPSSPGGARAGEWTHLVGTYSADSDELKLYINGELAGTTTYSTPWDARHGLQIGAGSYDGKPGSFFPGAIDEVQIFDKQLSSGEVTRLYSKESIISGRPARAMFAMDEPASATQLTGRAEVPDAKFVGDVSPGQPGVVGKAFSLDGTTGYTTTGRPLLDNQRSFAVSAWAKLPPAKPDHAAIIVTQAGVHRPGLELYYSSYYDRWAVNEYSADSSDATPIRAMQPDGTHALGAAWTHLVGVHDTVANKLTLYVNGVRAGETDLRADWYAGGPVQIGAGSYDGQPGSFFPGQIDDVRLYDRPVSAGEVQQLFRQRPLLKGRWTFEEQKSGISPDASPEGRAMALNGGASIGAGMIGEHGLELNGIGAYASAGMPVDTSGSFTITAWARAAAVPAKSASVVSGDGSSQSAFDVRFVPDPNDPEGLGRWQLAIQDKDASDATVRLVDNSEFYDVRDWNHLALTYDGFTKEARLYVNGVLQDVACRDDDGDGTPDDAGCTDLLSWADNVLAFKASGAFQVGRAKAGQFFPGQIDDVWAFQGALDDSQIEELATTFFDIPTEVPAGS